MKLFYNDDLCPKCNQLTDHYNSKCCRACCLARQKDYYKANKEHCLAYAKDYYKANKEHCLARKKDYMREYERSQRNEFDKTLSNIRMNSRWHLFQTLKHTKLPDYEIHHCFGYDDHTKFVYIPKSLHLKIHQYLRDRKIDAKTNHYREIVDMINECNEYTYIHA